VGKLTVTLSFGAGFAMTSSAPEVNTIRKLHIWATWAGSITSL
jgi:hypothetical protein